MLGQYTCEWCGKVFQGRPSRLQRFCSAACFNAGRVKSLEERFWSKVDKSGDCWLWTGGRNVDGYGFLNHGTGGKRSHVIAYNMLVGEVPAGMELDHLCRNRQCVNPAHLEPVTHRENVLRGAGPAARHAKKTHCIHGHPFDPTNTLVRMHGDVIWRVCRACKRQRGAETSRRRRLKLCPS